ncbi:nitroreductase family protein [Aminobacter sp. AP02]|uniref:nitroreductase family protein n=1 Tax=Aminobacter sp. AP02 TaxID=2135737 RepID=UPI000D7A3D67|nr:nitroreductase family protein [Aminobacter sp. AP02]PWK67588.1 nitroreductase [Aminobacter sp. AP02]
MEVIEAIHTRRSVRQFLPRKVERALLEQVILDAAWAPPPTSLQVPWTFNVVEGQERISAYGKLAKEYARAHRPEAEGWWTENPDFEVFWDAPTIIIISGPVEDCCRAGQNLMLSAHARGLGTCWVGAPMLWLRTPETKAELHIPPDVTPVSALCIGYPAHIPDAPPRGRPAIIWSH